MKTIKFFSILLLSAITTFAFATETPRTNVQALDEDKFLVAMETSSETMLEVSMTDAAGNIVYYKESSNPVNAYTKIFNVKNLENGVYTFEMKTNEAITKRDLTIANNNIYVGDQESGVLLAPYFNHSDGKLVLSHLNFEKDVYNVSITGEQGLVYEGPATMASPMNVGFDVSALKSGTYELVMNSGDNEFSYTFEK